MEDFDAMDYFDEILDEVRGHIEVDDKYTYIGDRLAGADNVKPYCVADSFCAGVENEKEGAVFTEAAFWLDCFYRYENGGLEDMVEQFLSNSEAETYEELIEECDEAEFSFDDYYCDYISGGAAGYHFLVKNDLTVSTDSDKQDVEETIKKYKNITEVDFHLNDVAEILYDEEDREWIFEK